MKNIELIKSALFLAIGIILITATILIYQDTSHFLKISSIATGKVVYLNHGGSHPEIEFTTQSGETISYPQGGFIRGMKVGDEVHVRYLPTDPRSTARLTNFGAMWFWELITGIIGTAFSLVSIAKLFEKLKHQCMEKL